MSAEELIRYTLARYAHVHDGEDVESVGALFTEDGALFVVSGAHPVGRAALKTFMAENYARRQAANRRMKHVYANSEISIATDTAHVTTDFVAYESVAGGPWEINMIGHCVDRLVHRAGQWLFAERRVFDDRPPRQATG